MPGTSPFAGDDGSVPPLLAAALSESDAQRRLEAVVEALRSVRVLVPVVARLDEMADAGDHGIAGEKSAHAAMVTVAAPDGRAVLPAFGGTAALLAWRAEARPVPVDGRRAALAAATEADGVLVVDPGSAVAVQVPRPAVRAIALGEEWIPALRNPRVLEEASTVLTRVPGVRAVRLEPGRATEVRIVLWLDRGIDPALDARMPGILQACREALARSQAIVDLVDSVTVRPAITH